MSSGPSTRNRIAGGLLIAATIFTVQSALAQQMDYQRPVDAAPQPGDIGGGYVVPTVQRPLPRAMWRHVTDVGVLVGALGLGSWIVLKRRNRHALVALTIGSVAYFGFYREGCVCPIGAIQNVAVALVDPSYALSYIVLAIFFLPLIFTVFFGRVFCGGVCPLGAIQELVLVKPWQVPRRLDWALGWLKWVYLGLAIWLAVRPAVDRDFIICRFDPFVGFFRFAGPLYMQLIGAALLVLGLFVGRAYCRYLCPYGAILSLLARIAWRGVTVTPDKELDCGLCAAACPYGAIENLRAVRSSCLSCARCFERCPRHRVQASGGRAPQSSIPVAELP